MTTCTPSITIPASTGEPIMLEKLRSLVRDIPDYPSEGITFRDITPFCAIRPGSLWRWR